MTKAKTNNPFNLLKLLGSIFKSAYFALFPKKSSKISPEAEEQSPRQTNESDMEIVRNSFKTYFSEQNIDLNDLMLSKDEEDKENFDSLCTLHTLDLDDSNPKFTAAFKRIIINDMIHHKNANPDSKLVKDVLSDSLEVTIIDKMNINDHLLHQEFFKDIVFRGKIPTGSTEPLYKPLKYLDQSLGQSVSESHNAFNADELETAAPKLPAEIALELMDNIQDKDKQYTCEEEMLSLQKVFGPQVNALQGGKKGTIQSHLMDRKDGIIKMLSAIQKGTPTSNFEEIFRSDAKKVSRKDFNTSVNNRIEAAKSQERHDDVDQKPPEPTAG